MDDDGADGALDGRVSVAITHAPLDVADVLNRVRSPAAGALVLFAGTTRNSFEAREVVDLTYSAYTPRAVKTMRDIAADIVTQHGLLGIHIVHRLGRVPVGEESILIAVAAAHRQAAWRAGEECLERVKERVEVWKLERFKGEAGAEGEEGGEAVWRANRDGARGVWIDEGEKNGLV